MRFRSIVAPTFASSIGMLAALEELNRALMPLGGGAASERAEVPSTAGAGILLPRIQTILAGLELSNHGPSGIGACIQRADRGLDESAEPIRRAVQSVRREAVEEGVPE